MTTAERPRLVLLHGVGLDSSMWSRCRDKLSAHAEVVTPDLPGHGARPPARDISTVAELAAGVPDLLGDGAHLVGFSLGALVAQHVAITHPSRVRSLVLVSAVAHRDARQRASVLARYEVAERSLEESAHAAVRRWFSPSFAARDPELVTAVTRTLLANDRESYLACYRVFAHADADLWPRLPQITVATLAVTGADDTGSTPRMTLDLAAAIPHARSLIVPDAGHLLPLEQPAALVDAILDHLARLPEPIREPS